MTARVLLHVGAMKTGTSYVQGLLGNNRRRLADAGVLVAPNRSAAVHDLMDFDRAGQEHLDAVRGAWDETVALMRAYDGEVAVLSHEYLSFVAPRVVRRVGESFAGAELHVLVTVRDAAGTLPAQWQTFARNRGTMTWPEYAAAARDEATTPGDHTFLRSQRVDRMLRRWGALVPAGRLHVVTVPRAGAGPDLLWERVAEVVGVDPAVAADRAVADNSSVGYASAHLLCLLHQADLALPVRERRRLAQYLTSAAFTPRRALEPRPMLDAETLRFASAWNERTRAAVSASGAHLVGSPADLPVLVADDPALRDAPAMAVPAAPDVLDAAAAAGPVLETLLAPDRPAAAWSRSRWEGAPDPVRAAVAELGALLRAAYDAGATRRLNPRGTALRG